MSMNASAVRSSAFSSSRLSVSLMFLANGFLVGSWAPKIPEFAERLRISESGLGVMIFFFGIGSLVAMPLVGMVTARYGSRPPLRLTAALTVPVLLPVTYVTDWVTAAIALFLFGAVIGGMDVAMNSNAVEVEKREGRAIMSSCHGFWSLGGVLGSILGGYLIGATGIPAHAIIATALAGAATVFAWPRIMADPPHPVVPAEDSSARPRRSIFTIGAVVWLLGIMCLFSMLPEGATLDWSALYLRQELDAGIFLSGLAFGAFSAAMAIMRFMGDIIRDRIGAVLTLRISAVFAIIGMLAVAFAPSPLLAVAGFGIAGIGLANMVPICFSAAGNLPGLPQGVAISLVTFLGYSGILFAPSIIGFIAEHTGFTVIFAGIPVLLAFVLALSGLVHHADTR